MTEVRLVQTCDSYPEQYDAYIGNERVAYLRLRHGVFRVQCPHIDDEPHGFLTCETVYLAEVGGGEFSSDGERACELSMAKQAILEWVDRRDVDAWTPARPPLTEEQQAGLDKHFRELMRLSAARMPSLDQLLPDRPLLGPPGGYEIPAPRGAGGKP